MNFIQSAFLMGLAAIAIPLALHFLTRWQVQRIDLGTLRFMREIVQDGARRRVVRRWFLLFTRMAIVALLALLFARPYLPQRFFDGKNRMRIIMIDRSASMGMRGESGRLVDDALTAAVGSANELGQNAQILWAWFDDQVTPIKNVAHLPEPPKALHGNTNYFNALSWARDQIAANKSMQSDVVFVTDLQQSGMTATAMPNDKIEFPKDAPIRIIDVGRPVANNLSITAAGTSLARVVAGSQVSVRASLYNFSPLGYEEIPLIASATNGTQSLRVKKTISLGSKQGNDFTFELGELSKGEWEITISADVDDDLAFDNTRFAAIAVAEPVSALVVDSTSDKQPHVASFYLTAALESKTTNPILNKKDSQDSKTAAKGEFSIHRVTSLSELIQRANTELHPICIVADSDAVDRQGTEQLTEYVRAGGKLLVFANETIGSSSETLTIWNDSQLVPGKLSRVRRAGGTPYRIVRFDAGSSMLDLFADPQQGDLSRIAFQKVLPVAPNEGAQVLASFDQEIPAITEHRLGQGRIVWFMSAADGTMSNWTKSPLYVPLVQQMASDLVGLTGEGPIRHREIGSHTALANTFDQGTLHPVAYQPSDNSREMASDAAPGFKRIGDCVYVLNTPTKESDINRVTLDEFAKHYELEIAGAALDQSSKTISETRAEYWYWLAAALLAMVIGEYALSNRTSA